MSTKLNLKKILESINYKINDGGSFNWNCYGQNAFALDCSLEKGCVTFVFDTKNQIVYEVSVCDYSKNKAYRWIYSKFDKKHELESKKRGFSGKEAWDDVDYEAVGQVKILDLAKKITKQK